MAHIKKTPKKVQRKRFQLVFDNDTAKKAAELKAIEGRSFNNLVQRLINQEWDRQEKAA